MKRLYVQHMILSGTLVFALGACAHKPAKSIKADILIEGPSLPPQHTVLLQEAHSEAANLRGEVASLKILMAKQMGELQSLRKQSQSVQHREQDQGLQLQNVRSQLLSSQAERDQLRKQNMELEGQVASMPDTSQLVSNIQALRGSFQKMMSTMKGLVADMYLIKQEMHIAPKNPKPQQTKMATSLPTATMTNTLPPDAQGRIIIQEGDTLWQLSRTYQISVPQIQEWNNLSSDLIMTGLRLKITEPMETATTQPDHAKTATTSPAPTAMIDNLAIPAQETPQPTMETHVDIPSEPTHILSIASPQSDSHESP